MHIDGSERGVLKFEAGRLYCRHVRAQVDALSLSGREYKGLLSSTFVVRGDVAQLSKLLTWLRSFR